MDHLPDLSITNPAVLVGLFVGAMLTFVFVAFTMSGVQRAAQSVVVEVRRQFKEIAGIMEGKADPDYASCVDLCTKGAFARNGSAFAACHHRSCCCRSAVGVWRLLSACSAA